MLNNHINLSEALEKITTGSVLMAKGLGLSFF